MNGSVADNILLGSPYNSVKFNEVLKACGLDEEVSGFPEGVNTIIGDNGVNLSGGQKQRIAIARACYRDADLYLFDDSLSALDVHKCKHIFNQVISQSGMLCKSTRILVTQQYYLLPKCDIIYLMKDGTFIDSGTYAELSVKYKQMFDNPVLNSAYVSINQANIDKPLTVQPVIYENVPINKEDNSVVPYIPYRPERSISVEQSKLNIDNTKPNAFIRFSKAVKNFGILYIPVIIFAGFSMNFYEYRISRIAEEMDNKINLSISLQERNDTTISTKINSMVIIEYGLIETILTNFLYALIQFRMLKISERTHTQMLNNLFLVSLEFFHKTSIGSVLNHFSRSIEVTDIKYPKEVANTFKTLFRILSSLLVLASQPTYFTVTSCLISVAIFYYFLTIYFIPIQKQLKKLQSKAIAPLFSIFIDSINGLATIGAFQCVPLFIKKLMHTIDIYNQVSYTFIIMKELNKRIIKLMANFTHIGSLTVTCLLQRPKNLEVKPTPNISKVHKYSSKYVRDIKSIVYHFGSFQSNRISSKLCKNLSESMAREVNK